MYKIPWDAQRILHHLAHHSGKHYSKQIAEALDLTSHKVAMIIQKQLPDYVDCEKLYINHSGTPVKRYWYNGKQLPEYLERNMENPQ
jgi:hypothetical protein